MRFLLSIPAIMVIPFVASASTSVADEPPTANVAEIVARVDAAFEDSWQRENVTPADQSSDSEFLRRLYLDLAGRIPPVSKVRQFLADETPDKRGQIVNELLDSPAFVRHFTTVLRNALIPQANSQVEFRGLIPGFEAWLWKHLSEGRRYDEIAREIITTELNTANAGALTATTSADAFFVVRELKPENLAAGTARAFLGVRLDCAQCHDHPFDRWSQQQFWNMAAFYSGFSRPEGSDDNPAMMMTMAEQTDRRSIAIPGTEEVVPAMFLTGGQPEWGDQQKPRGVLADWIVGRDNPWFAKMAVNRIWAQFFGRGIVDPVDDFSDSNPPSHPDVLQMLADDFTEHGYDLQRLVRIIARTSAYQRSGIQSHPSQEEPSHFARATLRGLTPEQLFDSLAEAVGVYQPYRSDNPFVVDTNSPRAQYLQLFRDTAESPLDRETTILQALAMMNGSFIADATDLEESRTLRAIVEFPGLDDSEKLNTLCLASLSRLPSDSERSRFGDYLSAAKEAGEKQAALADIFWVLLNSSEFLLNH